MKKAYNKTMSVVEPATQVVVFIALFVSGGVLAGLVTGLSTKPLGYTVIFISVAYLSKLVFKTKQGN